MKNIFISSDNILSPVGSTSAENFSRLSKSVTGIKKHENADMSEHAFYGSLFEDLTHLEAIAGSAAYTRFEQLLIASISDAINNTGIDLGNERTLLIISSTKGNISLLETETRNDLLPGKIALHQSAKKIAAHFHFVNQPIVISNACISGLLALITAKRLIQSGQYDHAVVAGADVISKFVLSGFQSFQAISDGPCKPFDKHRKGINLGEGAATIVLTSDEAHSQGMRIMGGAVSNDANHISGPSRTGEELCLAIEHAMKEARLAAPAIDFISAHGTATLYNDEMEAKAFNLAQLERIPVNSLKGYYGHTLGAAGLIESVISMHSMKNSLLIPTMGFDELGVTMPLNVCSKNEARELQNCLKTASGFGGCNAAIIINKH